MNHSITRTLLGVALAASLAVAQIPVAKQPKPKSQKEYEAVMAIFNTQDSDGRIAAGKDLITKFADSEFKETALQVIAMSYQQKNDAENTIIWAEKTLEANPKSYPAMILIASTLAQRTKEFDLDKEEKLAKSEKMATEAIELAKVAPKPQAQIPDEQWELARKEYVAQGHEALGIAALARKKYDVAEQELQSSVAASMQVDPAILVRLGNAQGKNGKFDAAIATLDKAIADPQAVPIVKQAAQSEKAKIMAAKAAAAPKQ